MAVDLYVGTLTRYYAGQWENVAQKMAREQGLRYQVIRPGGDNADAVSDPAKIEPAIAQWQRNVAQALQQSGGGDAAWQEGLGPPYFTDRIGWDPLFALMLWASYLQLERQPPRNLPKDMTADPAFAECMGNPNQYQLTTILSAQFWLPVDLMFFTKFPSPRGDQVDVSSVDALLYALGNINERSWRTHDWRAWLADDIADTALLETPARYGFAVLASMAAHAKQHHLPIVLSF